MKIKNALLLSLTVSIWGVALVARSVGVDYVGPFTFNCARCLMGGVVLPPYIWFFDGKNRKRKQVPAIPGARKTLVMGGICRGVALCLVSNFQQSGIQYTTMGGTRFITACYIVIVLALGLLLRKKCSPVAMGVVVLSLVGLHILCMNSGEPSVNKGDLLVLVCTFLLVVHVTIVDFFSPVIDGVKMSYIQPFVSGILSGGAMLVSKTPEMSQAMTIWAPVLYVGIMSYGVVYTLQVVGQKGIDPTAASPILSLESSISVLTGWVILGQRLSSRGVPGCVFMLSVIILAQIPVGRNREASLNIEGNQKARYKKTASGFPAAS